MGITFDRMQDDAMTKYSLPVLIGTMVGLFSFLAPGALFIFVLAAFLTSFMAGHCSGEEEKKFVVSLFVVGFLSRVILTSWGHIFFAMNNMGYHNESIGVTIPDLFADSGAVSLRGWLTSLYMQGKLEHAERLDPTWLFQDDFLERGYGFIVYTLFYYIFGFSHLSAKFINCLLGSLSAILVYFISRDVFNKAIARIAAVLAMFFPSLYLWSLSNLKDPMMVFLLCLSVYLSIRFSKYRKLGYLIMLAICLYLVKIVRPSYIMPVLVSAVLSIVFSFARKVVVLIVVAASIFMILAMVMQPLDIHILDNRHNIITRILEKAIDLQRGFVLTGGSVYKVYEDKYYATPPPKEIEPLRIFIYLPKGWLYFLFTPFPWSIHTKLQMIAAPQVMLWYILALFALWGVLVMKRYGGSGAHVIFFHIFFITSAFALSSGNIGTALRHRDIILPFFFIFSSIGIANFFLRKAVYSD